MGIYMYCQNCVERWGSLSLLRKLHVNWIQAEIMRLEDSLQVQEGKMARRLGQCIQTKGTEEEVDYVLFRKIFKDDEDDDEDDEDEEGTVDNLGLQYLVLSFYHGEWDSLQCEEVMDTLEALRPYLSRSAEWRMGMEKKREEKSHKSHKSHKLSYPWEKIIQLSVETGYNVTWY